MVRLAGVYSPDHSKPCTQSERPRQVKMTFVLRLPAREYLESSCHDVTRYAQTVWYLAEL